MAEFGSKAVAGTGLGLGIAGTALSLMNNGNGGILKNVFGGVGNTCEGEHGINRYEASMQQQIARLESEVALRDANIYNDSKILETYKYIDGKIEAINSKLCDQAVFNATQTAAMNCMGGQIAQLFALTKLVVPNSSVCPGWGNVTITPAAATTATTSLGL
jgi:hypothetical protein